MTRAKWTRRAARAGAAIGIGVTLIASSGMALAAGHGQGQGHQGDISQQGDQQNAADATGSSAALQLLVVQGVLKGDGNGSLEPQSEATRAQMAVMLSRLLNWNGAGASGAVAFRDHGDIPDWAQAAVRQAAHKGIFEGDDHQDFRPQGVVTWAQASVIIDRVFGFPAVPGDQVAADLQKLTYGHQTPDWARQAVADDVAAGLFPGALSQIYMPNQPISRAELAVLLQEAEQIQPAAVAQANTVVVGTLSAVQSGSVTVLTAKGDVRVPLASGVVVYQAGVQSSLSALQVGQRVLVGIDGSGSGALVEILSAATGQPQASTVAGSVDSLSSSQITIAESDGTIATFGLAGSPTVTGAVSTLAAVLPGDQVTLTLNPGGQVTAIDVTGTPSTSTVSGAVTSVTASANGTITVAESNGGSYTFTLAGTPTVTGAVSTLAAVLPGDQVTLTLNPGGQVTAIEVTGTPQAVGTVTGTLVSTDTQGNSVVVLVYANNQPSLTTLALVSNAPVTLGNSTASLAALQTGDPVVVPLDANGHALSVQAQAVPATDQVATGSLVGNTATEVSVANGTGQVILATGTAPVAVAGGQIVALGSIAVGSNVTAVSGVADGSLLLIKH